MEKQTQSLIKPKIIIDTDPGHDDALALMLLLKANLFDVLGITTVAGNSSIENVTRNAAFILDLLKRKDIPLYSGLAKPLKRELVQAVVHGPSGLDGVDTRKTKYKLTGNAEEKIRELVSKNPHKITILTLGPLSNMARAFLKEPKLPQLIKRMVIMGGAINVCGNKNRVAEFNIFVDPEAADIVFQAKVPKVLIPLDVCNKIILSIADFKKLKGSFLYQPLIKMMRQFIKNIEEDEDTKGALVYDAIVAHYLINPKAFKLQSMDIVIETKGEYTAGMTVVEKRLASRKNFNVQVVVKLDKERFVKDLIKILRRKS